MRYALTITVRGKRVELTEGPYQVTWTNRSGARPWAVMDGHGAMVRQPPADNMHKALFFQTNVKAHEFAICMNDREGWQPCS